MNNCNNLILLLVGTLFIGCFATPSPPAAETGAIVETKIDTIPTFQYLPEYVATSFDYPVGKPNASGYYNAQAFGKNNHLGDDWNAVTGGNSDLGDPIFAIANGYVKFAADIGGGWGKVIRMLHQLPNGKIYESLYAHCDSILVSSDSWVKKGVQIATIGTADGRYYAHLHLEIRADSELPIGGGYAIDTSGYLDPTRFIDSHRIID